MNTPVKRTTGRLYLIPNTLGGLAETVATKQVADIVQPIRHFVVEEFKSARRYLRALGYATPFEEISISLLNEHTRDGESGLFLKPIADGHDVVLMSEAGCPCVADPGADLVRRAHEMGIRVTPLGVPSSILLTLMGSGLNGQNFAFIGYLPRGPRERMQRIKQLEQLALSTGQTQLFMDAPYRNNQVMGDILTNCKPTTWLCVGSELTLPGEFVIGKEVAKWRDKIPDLHKKPVMFAIGK